MITSSTPLIRLDGIEKHFGGIVALNGISLEIRPGTVHAFVGENGAGKSTLGKIISGSHAPDGGVMEVDGHPVAFATPRDAIKRGISTIQQEIALVPQLSALQNVFLGRERSTAGIMRDGTLRAEYDRLVAATGFDIAADARVAGLRLADQQKVEMMRAIARESKLIVFDEPTAALTPDETDNLLQVIRRLRDNGVAIIYVSHFLDEILSIADDITVLRNGGLVMTTPAEGQTAASLVTAMLGRSQESAFPERIRRVSPSADEVLTVRGLSRAGVLEGISFGAKRGEIVGIAGLVGSGRSELLRAVFGADEITSGTIVVDGRQSSSRSPLRSIAEGVSMLPESRKDEGLFLRRSVAENMTIGRLRSVSRAGIVSRARERTLVTGFLERLGVRPAKPDFPIGLMSGGNQQKVMLAKWLVGSPTVLLIDEPTRGVDVGAKHAIYENLFELAADGMCLIVVSSEIEEILGLSDRVIVMRRGRIALDAPRAGLDQDAIMRAAFGAEPHHTHNDPQIERSEP